MAVEFACSTPLQQQSFVSRSSRPTWGPWSCAAFTGRCWRSIRMGQSQRRGHTLCTLCWKPSSERQRWGRETQSARLSEIARCMFFNGRVMVWQCDVWFDTGQFEIPTSASEVRSMVWRCVVWFDTGQFEIPTSANEMRSMVWQCEVWFNTGQFEIPTCTSEVRSVVWQCEVWFDTGQFEIRTSTSEVRKQGLSLF